MKLIESGIELIMQEPGMKGVNKMIELAGRTCYKSEANITEDSSEAFVERMINSRHLSMLEHGAIYLKVPLKQYSKIVDDHDSDFFENPYTRWGHMNDGHICLSTNLRVLYEYHYMDLLAFLYEPTDKDFEDGYFHRRITLRFQADIHFYKDATRHRKHSFAIESTRWINYMRERFGMSISFMKPTWIKSEDLDEFKKDCEVLESIYSKWIGKGYKAECAAYFLCQGTSATVVMTAFASDWRHFFDLRLLEKTGKVHPDMLDLAKKAKQALADANLWVYVMSQPSKFD